VHRADAGAPQLEQLAHTPDSWRGQLLAYLDTDRISNEPTEPTNLLIKKVDHVGHGLRNFNNYPVRLLPHCDVERPSNDTLPTHPASAGSAAKELPVPMEIGLIVVAGSVARTL
jgi:Transposase